GRSRSCWHHRTPADRQVSAVQFLGGRVLGGAHEVLGRAHHTFRQAFRLQRFVTGNDPRGFFDATLDVVAGARPLLFIHWGNVLIRKDQSITCAFTANDPQAGVEVGRAVASFGASSASATPWLRSFSQRFFREIPSDSAVRARLPSKSARV